MTEPEVESFEVEGAEVAVRLAGARDQPALLLIHGFPSSSVSFQTVIGALAQDCFVIAPDLPGFGASEPIERPSFSRFADLLQSLLAQLGVASFHLYLHDFGAAVGLHLATRAPRAIRSLIVQNANAHESGMGPEWSATRAYWDEPTPEREAEATAHLTFEGTREQYVGGVPEDIAERIDARLWEEDWRIMSLPGRLETQRALVLDYESHVARFGEIARYLERWQPPALLLWGRHDSFFALDETLSWMKALPRMEAHILDGPHFLLQSHGEECAALMRAFVRRVELLYPIAAEGAAPAQPDLTLTRALRRAAAGPLAPEIAIVRHGADGTRATTGVSALWGSASAQDPRRPSRIGKRPDHRASRPGRSERLPGGVCRRRHSRTRAR